MWRNTAVAEFVEWLRQHNETIAEPRQRVGFYGLVLYSLHAAMRNVVDYLKRHDPDAAMAARASYAGFEQYGPDVDTYAWAATRQGSETCEEAVTRQLLEVRKRRDEISGGGNFESDEAYFYAEQNARLAQNAERYYRTMFRSHVASWNIRDTHMAETLEEFPTHLQARGQFPKIVIWAHNSHLGDARATQMGAVGELSLGQLVRERLGEQSRLVGFTMDTGSVVAASDWGAEGRFRLVRPALTGSYEELFHDSGAGNLTLPIRLGSPVVDVLSVQ